MAKKEISRPATAHIAPFGLRLQPELKERIEEAARAAGRSINAEISARLEASLEPSAGPDEVVKQLAYQLAESEHRGAQFALLAEMRLIDLVLTAQRLADLLESDDKLAKKIMTPDEIEDFVVTYDNAYVELQEHGDDVIGKLTGKVETALRSLAAAKRALAQPRADRSKLSKVHAPAGRAKKKPGGVSQS